MDSYRPQSPDLSSYPVPQSPDLSGLRPESPDLSGLGPPQFGSFSSHQAARFPGAFGGSYSFDGAPPYQPTSVPQHSFHEQQYQYSAVMPPRTVKAEADDDEYMPDAPARRSRRTKQEPLDASGGMEEFVAATEPIKSEGGDPSLGCELRTSFPVARIKRIMQADEDIGKVAQVTPTVVSRALELFMIKLISASAHQARGPAGSAGTSKGPRRVMVQHLKKAVLADEKFDFLNEIVEKVPDAPAKGKKENGSDSEDAKPKKRGKKRKDSADDF